LLLVPTGPSVPHAPAVMAAKASIHASHRPAKPSARLSAQSPFLCSTKTHLFLRPDLPPNPKNTF
jgi:hypothetical protein